MQVVTTLARASPVNMPDPIRKRFGYGQLWPLRPVKGQLSGRILYAGSDFPHPMRFRFAKDGLDHTVQNRPGRVRFDSCCVWFWSNETSPEASQCARFIRLRVGCESDPACLLGSSLGFREREPTPWTYICRSMPTLYATISVLTVPLHRSTHGQYS